LENFKQSLKLGQETRIDHLNDPELYHRTFLKNHQKKGTKQSNQVYFTLRRQRNKINKKIELADVRPNPVEAAP
jgi:hypothetical protein